MEQIEEKTFNRWFTTVYLVIWLMLVGVYLWFVMDMSGWLSIPGMLFLIGIQPSLRELRQAWSDKANSKEPESANGPG